MLPQRIVLIHPFLLHYHFARLQALSDACRKTGSSVYSLELASFSDQYRSLAQDQTGRFDNRVLFPGRSFEELSTGEAWERVKEELMLLKPDVVFIYGYCLGVMRRTAFWALRNGVGIVVIGDSNEFDRPRHSALQWAKRQFISRMDAAFVGGTSSAQYLQALGLPFERVIPGYDVVDNEVFRRCAEENWPMRSVIRAQRALPSKYFLFVGRLIPEKNLNRLLQAYEWYAGLLTTEEEPWGLVICGSGPLEEELRLSIDAMPQRLQARIQLRGMIRQAETADFYSCASCLLLPSTYETWGLVVNEAMACKLPVLASRRAGCAADLVKDGVTGWLCDPYDTAEMARLMANVHQLDPSARDAVGERAQQVIGQWGLEKFSTGALKCAQVAASRHAARGRKEAFRSESAGT